MLVVADGLCRIEAFLPKPTIMAHATALELRLAAATIIRDCVNGGPAHGGIANKIGEFY